MRLSLVAAAAALLVACTAASAAAPAPLTLKRITPTRPTGLITLRIDLNRAWKSSVLAPASATRLTVLYDSNADGTADYVGRIVYRSKALVETITGHGNTYEPVPVSRPATTSARFTHAVDALYTGVKKKQTLRIAVQLRAGARSSRLPRTGWLLVPEPR